MSKKPILTAHALAHLIQDTPNGILERRLLRERWQKTNVAIKQARQRKAIATFDDLIYDPTRVVKEDAMQYMVERDTLSLPDFIGKIYSVFETTGKKALFADDIADLVAPYFSMDLLFPDELEVAGIRHIEVKLFAPYSDWYYLETQTDYDTAYDVALAGAEAKHDAAWLALVDWAGDELCIGVSDGNTPRTQALARLYKSSQVTALLDVPRDTIKQLVRHSGVESRRCPDGLKRFRAADINPYYADPKLLQVLEDGVEISVWQLYKLTDLKVSHLQTLFRNADVRPIRGTRASHDNARSWYQWGDVRRILWPEGDHPTMTDLELNEETNGAGRQAWWSDFIINTHEEIRERKRKQREAREQRRRERREKREALRNQMIDNFPSWLREDDLDQVAHLHVGPTNSGKTHQALQELAAAGSGWYLAPLRLLAREMFDRLNQDGVYCNLLTGEERIDIPGAKITAATVEMFSPEKSGDCVVIDETHMVADDQRGWAWTRALVNAQAPTLHVITAPHGLNLLNKFFENVGVETEIRHHERLVPLGHAEKPWTLETLPPRTLLIAFSRRDVLRLKFMLQDKGRSTAVVYGALPPEVRLRQAQRFANGEVEICVATDAVGMGLNLPADNVVFSAINKFDGYQTRRLYASELQQIAGRAGRYGFSEKGTVSALDLHMLEFVKRNLDKTIPDLDAARIAPRTDEIELLEGDLAQRLLTWKQLNAIPDALRDLIRSTEMDNRVELAQFLSYDDLINLGVEKALLLVNAPVRRDSQEYWVECATAILRDDLLPLPPPAPTDISEGVTLQQAEAAIACMDIYLWLGYRQPFRHLVEEHERIVEVRHDLTAEMDLALMRRFDPTSKKKGRGRGKDKNRGNGKRNGARRQSSYYENF